MRNIDVEHDHKLVKFSDILLHKLFVRFQDETMGCNKLISADEKFREFTVVTIPRKLPSFFGYSSMKFVPGSNDNVIVALLSEEYKGKTATYITVFDLNGKYVLDPIEVKTKYKYEGVEFF